jgi:hypothetical protein
MATTASAGSRDWPLAKKDPKPTKILGVVARTTPSGSDKVDIDHVGNIRGDGAATSSEHRHRDSSRSEASVEAPLNPDPRGDPIPSFSRSQSIARGYVQGTLAHTIKAEALQLARR